MTTYPESLNLKYHCFQINYCDATVTRRWQPEWNCIKTDQILPINSTHNRIRPCNYGKLQPSNLSALIRNKKTLICDMMMTRQPRRSGHAREESWLGDRGCSLHIPCCGVRPPLQRPACPVLASPRLSHDISSTS